MAGCGCWDNRQVCQWYCKTHRLGEPSCSDAANRYCPELCSRLRVWCGHYYRLDHHQVTVDSGSSNVILTLNLALPLLGVLVISLFGRESKQMIKISGLLFSGLTFLASVWLFLAFDEKNPEMQFVEK